MIGISERNNITTGWDEFLSERNVFLKFWEEYLSNRNLFTKGFLRSPCERNINVENEIIKDDRNIIIPSITLTSDRNCIYFPICFSERNCIYKRFFREDSVRRIYLIPICFNEKYITIKFLKYYNNEKIIIARKAHFTSRNILTQLPPEMTRYSFRKVLAYFLPPNADERTIDYDKYHVKFVLPREFDRYFYIPPDYNPSDYTDVEEISCYHYDYTDATTTYDITYCVGKDHIVQEYYDGNRFIYEADGYFEKGVDGTITGDYFESLEVGLQEGFDYGELFLIDLYNNEIYNLSLDAIYPIIIYGQFTKNLYLISNQNNLFIRPVIEFNLGPSQDKFSDLYDEVGKDDIKFKIELMKLFFSKGYVRVKIQDKNLSYDWELFKKFPKRFLVPFEIYIDNDYNDCVLFIELIYYFPYRFSEMSKKYSVILHTTIKN